MVMTSVFSVKERECEGEKLQILQKSFRSSFNFMCNNSYVAGFISDLNSPKHSKAFRKISEITLLNV
jgi:hypothetical protein